MNRLRYLVPNDLVLARHGDAGLRPQWSFEVFSAKQGWQLDVRWLRCCFQLGAYLFRETEGSSE